MLTKEVRWFGPGEIAKRLGVTSKTLRVYEREGLVTPHRTEAGWRVYGPAQVERLHLVLALRDLGLPLKRIGKLISEKQTDLLTVLTVQQESLESQRRKITRGINLLSTARNKLVSGQVLSLDDLIHLTKETLMQIPDAMKSLKSKFDAVLEERLPGTQSEAAIAHLNQEISGLGKTKAELFAIFEQLMADGRELMAKGDETS
jgi:DNA-binding transcriptional MerR regulator